MSEQNKATVRQFIEDVFNTGNIAAADRFMAANYREHNPWPGYAETLDGFKQGLTDFRTAFPDLNLTIEDVIAEDDRVVLRVSLRGTHKGDFMGAGATGREVSVRVIDIVRLADGKIVEHWDVMDELGMMQQLGLVPQEA
jgi:steroid delta-isomerase-like uncharacterized protein